MGYFGLGAFDPTSHLAVSDVVADSKENPSLVSVSLKKSKADKYGQDAYTYLARNDSDLCPVTAVLRYLVERPNGQGPLCILEDGSHLRKWMLVSTIQQTLCTAGIEASTFKGHSFCIGVATATTAAGIPEKTITLLGH